MAKNLLFKKLFYRSLNRGCKETDIIFGKFAQNNLHFLSKKELRDYEKLLDIDDVIFCNWLWGKEIIPDEYNTVIFQKIKELNNGSL